MHCNRITPFIRKKGFEESINRIILTNSIKEKGKHGGDHSLAPTFARLHYVLHWRSIQVILKEDTQVDIFVGKNFVNWLKQTKTDFPKHK